MKTIEMIHPIEQCYDHEPCALAVGFFDGIHTGHQKVIETMICIAENKGLKKAVMTFDPHPSVVLNPEKQRTDYLTPMQEKKHILETMGIDYLFIVPFTSSLAKMEEHDFISNYFTKNHVKEVVAGFDFTYGKYGKGNMLKLEADKEDFNVTTVERHALADEKVSTTSIRKDLMHGDIESVNAQLGRPYKITGLVVQGEKRGRTIGFPTANVEPNENFVLPRLGVYAVTLKLDQTGKIYKGVCNVGVKPTFHDPEKQQVSIEVNIFDFKDSIYGERVEIEWYEFLRAEKKFDGIDSLIAQINADKAQAIEILNHIHLD
ncbi:bifunctional riboflavin kinase/FAD synthetase [Macrococcoides caseolyticum]|uniref:bifunctional riboflavin kinase/FAD synthetase n=1 Tax=Macrococcoides caseolyticum TaxID=69966 RepID=UPI000C3486F3|nr:bifunctional riboflavin kinase/FAD synthetase [Macrococcus caseolyticus]PKE12280.1 bifunctional riboflavin kinase/FAD synthetase [Macrococcus caseolyticus]PKE48595.1 bifunctional riboflavin kinase/FAD synthetase [Macrococcus caseolyticus]PKF15646.1 bifunctional riboflavin kinase/FAD synthetase [Macrococcus caseolyticus]PNZ74592.1 bifunctional riboflavin kinase/FAD synthetase [Macrococcus caseolyticus]QPT47331.1 bifunctional riboflavin kinase/FAD synthetase [Macrococcus caseolyticus]